ncbi:hypothetical protein SDRG_08702 [Saprolegnia diclina VS20]|uniref:Uncharacterized protein n=1 Tax=Saprolegnia diclina (strain VS20) TaxID=1156394 RepID=T0QIP4_SAPDV|nr:hypothetical protein SDRG_08702 [Saprolegnia diclina VS20]EQC33595.1 hypothetical protein SDRG_08702 [Saprolegnia diclina VS20]|eukprot:XP_008612818.1 hypothetical protein SDRG_08702 [Saprolegnia diclina VS20]
MVECEQAPVAVLSNMDAVDDGYMSPADSAAMASWLLIDDDDADDAVLPRRKHGVSGLPWTCSNCGVSFYSLRSVMADDCYCSGECKWSVILFREMDSRSLCYGSKAKAATYDTLPETVRYVAPLPF